ncbi:MAG: relaxase/mobilization nuclease domain-containing protein [Candidatus Ornithomonoglobus sp.]
MAITKIHAIRHTVGKSIKYICDDAKTNDNLIYSFNCTPQTAELEFDLTSQKARSGGQNKAYHMIQSFRPGEVTPEKAYLIAREWADKVLKGKYEYVLATHTDKKHIHTHIVFNAVSFKDYKRYKSDKRSYYRLREISDELCEQYGIEPVIVGRQKKKFEYGQQYKKYVSKKSLIKKAIDESILYALTYEDFLNEMKLRGFVSREDDFLWFRYEDDKRFSKTDTIGFAYKAENIQKRIIGLYKPTNINLVLDIESNIKCRRSKGYEHWAKLHNLQTAAKTLVRIEEMGLESYEDLVNMLSAQEDKIKSLKSQNAKSQARISEIDKIIRNNDIRKKHLPIIKEYNSKKMFKGTFYDKHKKDINSYNKAVTFLKPHMINGKYPNTKNLCNEKARLQAEITKCNEEMADLKSEHNDLSALKQNIDIFLGKQKIISEQQQEIVPQKNTVSSERGSLLARIKANQKKADEKNNQRKQSHHHIKDI